jgi:hypothetical protein
MAILMIAGTASMIGLLLLARPAATHAGMTASSRRDLEVRPSG